MSDPAIARPNSTEPAAADATAGSGDALTRALAAEHAAVYAYGVIGGKTAGRLRSLATGGFDAHRARRDQLRSLIARRSGSPAEPGPAYRLPFEVRTPADAVRLAVLVEGRLITAYLELAADRDPSLRRLAALAAQECATRAYGWQPSISAFPGMPGRAEPGTPAAGATPSPSPSPSPSKPNG